MQPCCCLSGVYYTTTPDAHDGRCSNALGQFPCLIDGVGGGIRSPTGEGGAIDANLSSTEAAFEAQLFLALREILDSKYPSTSTHTDHCCYTKAGAATERRGQGGEPAVQNQSYPVEKETERYRCKPVSSKVVLDFLRLALYSQQPTAVSCDLLSPCAARTGICRLGLASRPPLSRDMFFHGSPPPR